MPERPCPVTGCKTWIRAELMCQRHYRQLPDSILAAIARARNSHRSLDSAAYRAACRTAVEWCNRRKKNRFHFFRQRPLFQR
jgi:hypothetical protein